MNNLRQQQQALAFAIGARATASATLDKYKHALRALTNADQLAQKAEQAAQANLSQLTQEKIKTGVDETANGRAVYQQALLDSQVATTDLDAARQLVRQAEEELERLTKTAYRVQVELCKAIAAEEEPGLVIAARRYGMALARHNALTRFARTASASSGTICDPITDITNLGNPLKLVIDGLISGADLEPVTVTEQSILDAKLGGAA